jgi:hypothetical protein
MTYHDDLNDKAIQLFIEEPEWSTLSLQVLRRLNDDYYDQEIVDAIFQHWEGRDVTQLDAFWFARIYSLLCEGDVLCGFWDIGQTPGPDKDIAGNNSKLSILHKVGIEARFVPIAGYAGSDGDGCFVWREPMKLGQVLTEGSVKERVFERGRLPLEVGSTKPTATYRHLLLDGGVARWAYGSTKVWVFKSIVDLTEPW